MSAVHPLLLRLRHQLQLTEAERLAVELVPVRREIVPADQPILREGARPTRCFVLEAGLACSSKIVSNGGRQIIAFHIPGDIPDLNSLHLGVRDCDIWALATSHVALMEHRDLRQLCEEQPRVAAALWRISLIDGAVFREWVVNVGQREGVARIAHLLCEMLTRMEAAGLADGDVCAMPVTQDDIAEATALSHVHVNRMLQELRRRRLLSFGRGKLAVHQREALEALADFRTDYLHLDAAWAA
jgi:CRP-like cAMP-binding protein